MGQGRSAQPDEDRLADTGYTLDGVRGEREFGRPLKERSELIGVRNDIAGLVDRNPSASIPFDEIALHDLNTIPDRWQVEPPLSGCGPGRSPVLILGTIGRTRKGQHAGPVRGDRRVFGGDGHWAA